VTEKLRASARSLQSLSFCTIIAVNQKYCDNGVDIQAFQVYTKTPNQQ